VGSRRNLRNYKVQGNAIVSRPHIPKKQQEKPRISSSTSTWVLHTRSHTAILHLLDSDMADSHHSPPHSGSVPDQDEHYWPPDPHDGKLPHFHPSEKTGDSAVSKPRRVGIYWRTLNVFGTKSSILAKAGQSVVRKAAEKVREKEHRLGRHVSDSIRSL
jgi:hypothetical protein